MYVGKVFGFVENQQVVQKAKEERERHKADVNKLKAEVKVAHERVVKTEYVPNETTVKQLLFVQQVCSLYNNNHVM